MEMVLDFHDDGEDIGPTHVLYKKHFLQIQKQCKFGWPEEKRNRKHYVLKVNYVLLCGIVVWLTGICILILTCLIEKFATGADGKVNLTLYSIFRVAILMSNLLGLVGFTTCFYAIKATPEIKQHHKEYLRLHLGEAGYQVFLEDVDEILNLMSFITYPVIISLGLITYFFGWWPKSKHDLNFPNDVRVELSVPNGENGQHEANIDLDDLLASWRARTNNGADLRDLVSDLVSNSSINHRDNNNESTENELNESGDSAEENDTFDRDESDEED